MTNSKGTAPSQFTGLLAWQDLAKRLDVVEVRSIILRAIEGQITLGVYAYGWHVEYGRFSYDDNGEAEQEHTEGEDTGFIELQGRVLEPLLVSEKIELGYLYQQEGKFARARGRVVDGTHVEGVVHVTRDDLCGRLVAPTQQWPHFPASGVGPNPKKQSADEKLMAVLVELYRQEKAKSAKSIYAEDVHGLQAKLVADIDKMLTHAKIDKSHLGISTLKSKISKALATMKNLKPKAKPKL